MKASPAFAPRDSANFYVCYLRDTEGNKIAIYCASSAEGARLWGRFTIPISQEVPQHTGRYACSPCFNSP